MSILFIDCPVTLYIPEAHLTDTDNLKTQVFTNFGYARKQTKMMTVWLDTTSDGGDDAACLWGTGNDGRVPCRGLITLECRITTLKPERSMLDERKLQTCLPTPDPSGTDAI